MQYYYAEGDVQKGPFEKSDLPGRGVGPETLVWREGLAEWKRAGELPELRDVLAPAAAGGLDVIPLAPAPQPAAAPAQFAPAPYAQPVYAPPPQAYPAYGQPLAYGGYAPAPATTSGMAIASLILGILSIPTTFVYCGGLPCAILAIIFGHMARGKALRGEAGGGGMALAGLICGYIALALVLVLAIFFLAVFGIAAAGK